MKLIPAVLVLGLALPLSAQTRPDDLFKGFKMGDRAEIMLRSEFSVRGKLVQPGFDDKGLPTVVADPSVDLSTLSEIILDISMEYPDMTGYLGFPRIQVASVRKLKDLTPEEAAAIEKERQRLLAANEKSNDLRRARAARDDQDRLKEIDDAVKRSKEKQLEALGADMEARLKGIKKAAEIYKRFPPEAGWGPSKIAEIAQKARLRLPVTPEQQEFADNIDLWTQYDQYLKGEKDKEKDKAGMQDAPPAPSPSPAPQ